MDSEPFYISVLRQPGAFGALNRGSRMLRRAPPADVADSSQTFVAGVRMPNLRYPYVLRFDFEENVVGANRVNVLIGRNGAGKTQLIRNMILRLAEGFQQEGLQGQVRFNRAPRASRVLLFSSVSSDPYPRFVPPWHGIDYEYFSMTDARASGSDALLQSLMACRNEISPALKINGELTRRLHFLRKVLAPLQIWESLYLPLRQGSDEPDVLGHLVLRLEGARYFRFDQQVIERHSLRLYGEIDWTRTPVVINDAGVRHLSSGELAMFRFAAQAVSAIEQGSLLFFDEPETHLHPNFISDFMEILQTLLDGTHSIAIIATHSAYVVREVPRERVNVLAVEDKEMIVSAPRMQTFGASIDTISQFVFDDTSVGHSFQEKLTEWVRGPGRDLSLEQILERLGPDLNPESLSFIAEQKRRDSGDAT